MRCLWLLGLLGLGRRLLALVDRPQKHFGHVIRDPIDVDADPVNSSGAIQRSGQFGNRLIYELRNARKLGIFGGWCAGH